MHDEYPIRTIADVCYVTDGAHARVQRQPQGVPYLTSKNIGRGRLLLDQLDHISQVDYDRLFANTSRAQRRPAANDVVIGIIGTFGNAYLYKQSDHFGISSAVALLRPVSAIVEPKFLYYVITSPTFRAAHSAYKSGSVQGYTNIPTVKRLPVPVPPLPEQRAIAHILGTLDDKIELNRRMNEMLEAIARALFKSWFVDFDPVRAKAEGRDTGLPSHIADLFPDAFEDSALREIPKGWHVATIGDLADVVGGSTPSTANPSFWGGDHCWATPRDLSALSTPVLLSTERRITNAGLSQISSGLLPAGTVLLSSRAPIGYLAIAEVPVAINQGFIAMRAKDRVSNIFLLIWARVAHEEIISRANGSTFLEISKSNFRPIPVAKPTPQILAAFDGHVRPIYSRIVANERESRTLTALRDALLPKLISGEIRVKDAERFVRSAV
jgi:type I restriction enzyme S subunit